jgi:hypothetical protein
MKTSELTGAALDWTVAKAEGQFYIDIKVGKAYSPAMVLDGPHGVVDMRNGRYFRPSTDWTQGGPIIEQERMMLVASSDGSNWQATRIRGAKAVTKNGPTPLIAAMRCFVASQLGNEVDDIPKELT